MSKRKPRPDAARIDRLSIIVCTAVSRGSQRGTLIAGPVRMPCALGRAGLRFAKREGDGATPVGRYRLIAAFWRPDRQPRPVSSHVFRPIRRDLGWCDDPRSANYNRLVPLPFTGRHEALWRADALYDMLLALDYNLGSTRRGLGSAIFIHIAAPTLGPTQGCLALRADDLRRLLGRLSGKAWLILGGESSGRPLRAPGGARAPQARAPKIAVPIRTSVAPSWSAKG